MDCAECLSPAEAGDPSAVALGTDEDVFHGYVGALRQPKPVFFEFLVTERCNMRCAYCWEKGKRSLDMTKDLIKEAVNFCIHASGSVKNIEFFFFGGEPFLRFDLVQYIWDLGTKEAEAAGKTITWSTTTNGTLLTEEVAAWCAEHKVKYLLSLDGGQLLHDRYRKFADGTGSFETIKRNIRHLKQYQPWLGARVTLMPDHCDALAENIWELLDLGINQFIVGRAHGRTWTDDEYERYVKGMCRLGDMYIALKKRKWPIRISTFEDEELKKHGQETTFGCGAGRGRLAIDARGDLYGCGKMANIVQSGKGILPLGNVFQGFTRKQNREDLLDATAERRTKCYDCSDNGKCSGGCPAINGEATGSIFAPFGGCRKENANHARIVEYIIRRKQEEGMDSD